MPMLGLPQGTYSLFPHALAPQVHAILTDVNLQKVSPKVLRFIPAAPSPALALAEHLLAHAAAKSQSSTGGAGGLGLTALHNALGLGSPLRAGGVHTGPGGSGLQQSFSGPITNALTTSQSVTGTCVAGEDIAGSLATSLSAASATSVVQLPKVHVSDPDINVCVPQVPHNVSHCVMMQGGEALWKGLNACVQSLQLCMFACCQHNAAGACFALAHHFCRLIIHVNSSECVCMVLLIILRCHADCMCVGPDHGVLQPGWLTSLH